MNNTSKAWGAACMTSAALLLSVSPLAAAQAELNWRAAPTYGSVEPSLVVEPVEVRLRGRQAVDRNLGTACRGHVHAAAPDLQVSYPAGAPSLPVYIHAESSIDTTLVVRGPDGRWYCDDDTIGLNPVVEINHPQAGDYQVWVGSYSSNRAGTAQLSVSLTNPAHANQTQAEQAINHQAAPRFDRVRLRSGFTPDPYTVQLQAGGADSARGLGGDCRGHIHQAAPDVTLNYSASQRWDRLYFDVRSERDTTLVVRAPDGRWHCDDDTIGLDPVVVIQQPASGDYAIWVGTFSRSAEGIDATLSISEIDPAGRSDRGETSSVSSLRWDASPTYGDLRLQAGFKPDPHLVELMAGGSHRVDADLGHDCVGRVNAHAPDVRLDYRPGRSPLYLRVNASADTTLVVRAPDGTWHCNDDAIGLDPVVSFADPQRGRYSIWVGVYSGQQQPATLNISEVNPRSF